MPLSTTEPVRSSAYGVRLELQPALPPPFEEPVCWAKCDMLATVSIERLDLFRTGREPSGKRRYLTTRLPTADMERIRFGILCGLGFIDT